MSYTCNGNNEYTISLRVYRDCGGGGAQFDSQLGFAVYDVNNNLVTTVTAPKGPTVPISSNPGNDPCLVVPSGLCSEYADYIATASLPPMMGGYVISSQRCCRNSTIDNVSNSGSYGNTWTTNIPSMDTTCNNSPVVNTVAPTILCLGENINLSIAASEPDGDSLFYELCDVYTGGGQSGGGCNSVVPNPPCPPPFNVVPLTAPFTPTDPMPANPVVSINPQTGVLSGVPTAQGQYLIGFCISEYRNGQLMSTVRLDYQFNISNCGRPASVMVTPIDDPTILCDGLTVRFISNSINSNGVLWDFGVLGINTDTSSKPVTTYTYPTDGIYTVSLIVNPGDPCSDTSQFDFDVKKLVDVALAYTGVNCFEVQGFEFEPTGLWPDSANFNWFISPGANISTWSGQKTPPITWSQPGLHTVELFISFQPGCIDTLIEQIEVSSLNLLVDAGPDQFIDSGQYAQLNAIGGAHYFWYANKPAYFNNQYIGNAMTLPIHDTTVYYVEVEDEFGCRGLDSLTIYRINSEPESVPVMNILTPNGDGYNEFLNLVQFTDDSPVSLTVMDRWGKVQYQRKTYDNNWRGTNGGGKDLPDGTYYFIVQRDNKVVYAGPITIVRLQQ